MKWLQFFRPVASIDWSEATTMIKEKGEGEVVLLDVRQPREYEKGHLPGTKLIPLGDLEQRLDELDGEKPIVVY